MARLFADENFPLPVVEELRRLGHDVLTMPDADLASQALTDKAVLRRAREDGRAVLTLNRQHFIRLHRSATEHAGIIVCTVDPDFRGQATCIHTALAEHADVTGSLLRVNRPDQ